MGQARTHTNTPPAETIALKSEPAAATVPQPPDSADSSPSSEGVDSMTGSNTSPPNNTVGGSSPGGGPGSKSLKQPNPRQHMSDYLRDMRSLDTQGCITPSQQQSVQEDDVHQHCDGRHHTHHKLHKKHTLLQHHGDSHPRGSQQDSSFNTTMTYNNTTIFKPFDIKTGQFIPTSTATGGAVTQGDGGSSDAVLPGHLPASSQEHSQHNNINNNISRTQKNAALGSQNRLKFRSHSVPTILHSSFRRFNGQQHLGISTSTTGTLSSTSTTSSLTSTSTSSSSSTSTSSSTSHRQFGVVSSDNHVYSGSTLTSSGMPSAGIKKKKHGSKSGHHSLRNAILLSHRLQSMDSQDVSMEERILYIKSYPGPMPLPPINLQCLREIDLSEIVKNPQLRHDIVFDPLLQFRPNLDGERGIKKRQISEKYWADVENEIIVYTQYPEVFNYNSTRLVPLFDTLKDVLVTIVPQKEIATVENVLDTELLIQELLKGSLVMTNLSDWLAQLFKHHCAPMRDPWVDGMQKKFREAQEDKSVTKLVEALKLVFQILEAMKLDIANHQIRILRPALLSNAVEFEKQYFQSLMNSQRVNLKPSLKWFRDNFEESCKKGVLKRPDVKKTPEIYRLCIRSIISLLSCRKMVREYPTSLSFDHARLILLRADIRQAVCLLVCKLLFKQLVANDTTVDRVAKEYIISNYSNRRLKEEIVSIITDEHGNCRWTKNTMSIAIHLCKTINELKQEYETFKEQNTRNLGSGRTFGNASSNTVLQKTAAFSIPLSRTLTPLDSKNIDFAKSWLSKQTQPLSEVYGVLENRVFNSLEESIFLRSNCTKDGTVKQDFINLCSSNGQNTSLNLNTVAGPTSNTLSGCPSGTPTSNILSTPSRSHHIVPNINSSNAGVENDSDSSNNMASMEMEEFESLYRHLYTVVNFHWSVFGCHYVDSLSDVAERA